jgi:hypothetical protein
MPTFARFLQMAFGSACETEYQCFLPVTSVLSVRMVRGTSIETRRDQAHAGRAAKAAEWLKADR